AVRADFEVRGKPHRLAGNTAGYDRKPWRSHVSAEQDGRLTQHAERKLGMFQNGCTITMITMPISSSAGTSLKRRNARLVQRRLSRASCRVMRINMRW